MIKNRKYVVKEDVRTRTVKNWQGKEFNSGFTKSVMLHFSTHERLSKLGNLTSTYEKIIIKLLSMAEKNEKIKKEIMEFDYRKMKVE